MLFLFLSVIYSLQPNIIYLIVLRCIYVAYEGCRTAEGRGEERRGGEFGVKAGNGETEVGECVSSIESSPVESSVFSS